jgi:hypothetical protein
MTRITHPNGTERGGIYGFNERRQDCTDLLSPKSGDDGDAAFFSLSVAVKLPKCAEKVYGRC